MSDLFDAIDSADAGTVWRLTRHLPTALLHQVDDSTGLTPLGLAVEAGLTEVIRILLEAGADPDNGGTTTPLDLAVASRSMEIVETLLEAGAEVDRELEEGHTALMTAAATGEVMLIKRLLRAGARPRKTNAAGDTPMVIARNEGFAAAAEVLRQAAGWRRKGQSRTGKVRLIDPAELAAKSTTETPMAEDAGHGAANGSAPDEEAAQAVASPPEIADDSIGTPEMVQQVEELAELLAAGDDDAIGELFRSGTIDVERADEEGVTLLMVAAHLGHRSALQLLIDYGAEVDAADREQGRTALIHAIRSRSPERGPLVAHLLRSGADAEKHCAELRTPLMHAVELDLVDLDRDEPEGFANTTKILLRHGADPKHDPKLAGETVRQLVQKDLGSVPVGSPMAYRMQDLLNVLDNARR